MIKEIFKNYNAFYNMVLSTTIMSNAQTEELKADAEKIIHFIGKAYGFADDFISYCQDVILNDLTKLGRTTDQQAAYSMRRFGDKYTDKDSLFDIKGDVLATIHSIGEKEEFCINKGWFDYTHYKTYQADIRFAKIENASACGNVITTRQVGILSALGIGCEANYDYAILRLMQCALWGDIPAIHYLAYVYGLKGDDKNAKIFCELAKICEQYLNSGSTVLPEKCKTAYCEEARTYFIYISSIQQDVIYANKLSNIDFSFVEAIMCDELDYYQRMGFINNYSARCWKDVTNSSCAPVNKLGFNN